MVNKDAVATGHLNCFCLVFYTFLKIVVTFELLHFVQVRQLGGRSTVVHRFCYAGCLAQELRGLYLLRRLQWFPKKH